MAVVTLSVRVGDNGEQREAAHKAKMQEIAKLVVGTDLPSAWVCDLLSDWSFEVRWSHSIEGMLPKNKKLVEDMNLVAELADKLSKLLASPMTAAFIATGAGKDNQSYIDEGLKFLSTIATDSRKAQSPRLASSDGKVIRGRGRAHLPGRRPPKYVCAAIIAEVWSFFHQDQEPTPYIRDLQLAAARYYGAWFTPSGWGNNELKGWVTYLKSIGHQDLQAIRKEVRRHLNIQANFEAQMKLENIPT